MQLRFHSDNSVVRQIARLVADDCADASELMVQLYVDQVSARLTDVPQELRSDICRELRQHIESLIAAHFELGDDRPTATVAAIRQFGEPKTIALRFCHAWKSTGHRESTPEATCAALKIFCLGMVVYSLGLLTGVPYGLNLHGSVDAALRSGWLWDGMFLVPLVAGANLGWRFPRTSGRGAFYALAMLTAVTAPLFAVAITCGNQPGSTLFTPAWYTWACCAFLFPVLSTWLPIGTFSAVAVGTLRSHRDRKASRA